MTYLRPLFGGFPDGIAFAALRKTQEHAPALYFIHLDELFGKISNFTDVGLNQKNEYDIKATTQKTKIPEWHKLKNR